MCSRNCPNSMFVQSLDFEAYLYSFISVRFPPQTIVEMPNLKHIIDKYRNLSPFMTIFVNVPMATLHLTLETDVTTLISNFMNLKVDHQGNTQFDQGDDTLPNSEFSCQVETKSLALFMTSIPYPVTQKCLLINDNSCVKFRFSIKDDVNLYGIASQVSD